MFAKAALSGAVAWRTVDLVPETKCMLRQQRCRVDRELCGESLFSSPPKHLRDSLSARRRIPGRHGNCVQCAAADLVAEKVIEPMKPLASKRMIGRGSRMIGSGSATPSRVISNELLSTLVETNDEWIASRTGIRNRRVLSGEESLTSLAVKAAEKALAMAETTVEEIDLIILCTSTPDDIFGGATQVQAALGCKNAVSFDLTAACSGFVMGLVTATRFVTGGGYEKVLVIGADALSRYVDWTDRGTCILFGDGAGAVVLRACAEGEEGGFLGFDMRSDGVGYRHLHARIGIEAANGAAAAGEAEAVEQNGAASRMPVPKKAAPESIFMNGKEVFRFAVKAVPQVVNAAMEEAGLVAADVDWLLLHQANQRILDAVSEKMSIPPERVISNLANYGNTSAASIPLALDEAVRDGKVQPGQIIVSAGFGAGLTWASVIFRWC
eukprot:TRINITY_DN11021_c0_g1_i1.p1 TRINITY_DN11021_c0_g1~~TRINITY_DN11021_c0_g1_i1.p1  ORF type:complete len:440 (+),score=75.22 TRINITY_DN11021_c0_g1_i1:368-1687(+)